MVDITDDLSWGPITTEDFGERQTWLNQNLPFHASPTSVDESWDWIASGAKEFLTKLEQSDEHLVWVAPQNTEELCGLHWYLHHFGVERASFIMVEHCFPGTWQGQAPRGIGELGVEQYQYLLKNANSGSLDTKRFARSRWVELCNDRTNLRLLENGTLFSAQDDFFDEIILEKCSTQWRKAHRVSADATIALWNAGHFIADSFTTWRLRELALAEKITCTGPIAFCPNLDEPVLVRLA